MGKVGISVHSWLVCHECRALTAVYEAILRILFVGDEVHYSQTKSRLVIKVVDSPRSMCLFCQCAHRHLSGLFVLPLRDLGAWEADGNEREDLSTTSAVIDNLLSL